MIASRPKAGAGLAAIRGELSIAREVQQASLPRRFREIPGLAYVSHYRPARCVGGDYYDFLPLQDGRWGIAIADVSGKGFGAALVMANLQGVLRAHSLHPRCDPATVVSNVNRLAAEGSPDHFFATLFYAEYEPHSLTLSYVNAGHNSPMLLRDRVLIPLTAEHAPVGLMKNAEYSSTTIQLEIADILVAYTDGIIETENSIGDAFGETRLQSMLLDCRHNDAHSVLQLILDGLSVHSAGFPPADDVTVVVVQVGPRPPRSDR